MTMLQVKFRSGLTLIFSSLPSFLSVTVDSERDADGVLQPGHRRGLEEETDRYHPMDACNPTQGSHLVGSTVGKQIERVTILKMDPASATEHDCCLEVGIKFYFTEEQPLILAHALYEPSDTFVAIIPDLIFPEYRKRLHEYELGTLAPWEPEA